MNIILKVAFVFPRHICKFLHKANCSGSKVPYGTDGTHNLEKKRPRLSPSGWCELENQGLLVDPEFSYTDGPGPSPQGNDRLPQTLCVFTPVRTSLKQ